MIRYLIPLLLLLTACEQSAVNEPKTPAISESASLPGWSTVSATDTARVLQLIDDEHKRTEAEAKADRLQQVTYTYECDERSGNVTYSYRDDELVKVDHQYTLGDHDGQGDIYYFRNNKLILTDQEASSWQFIGAMRTDENGVEQPGTIDTYHRQRDYYFAGGIYQSRYKTFQLHDDETATVSDHETDQRSGTTVTPMWALATVQTIANRGSVLCTDLPE